MMDLSIDECLDQSSLADNLKIYNRFDIKLFAKIRY